MTSHIFLFIHLRSLLKLCSRVATVTGSVRNNLSAMSILGLEDHFCEWHLGDQYLILNIETLNFQPQTRCLCHRCHHCIL